MASDLQGRGRQNATSEVTFDVHEALEGGYDARAVGYSIFTQGEDWDDLQSIVRDAVLCHFDAEDVTGVIRLRVVRDHTKRMRRHP